MKARQGLRATLGVALCIVGFFLTRINHYREATVLIDANGCGLVTDVIDLGRDDAAGSVVLFHGLAANKKIMSYLAHGFAEQNLRVFVPDLPGHGRTQGPFSFARAESCAESLVTQLAARQATPPGRAILAGHSMGGAIAYRAAARTKVAAVVAISPAPMRPVHGLPGGMLPFENPPAPPANTLAITGAWEPFGIGESARQLVADDPVTSKYLLIPRATHVSVLFDSRVVRAAQIWAAQTLHLPAPTTLPSLRGVVGSLLGLAGILLLAGPFLRETIRPRIPDQDVQTESPAAIQNASLASSSPALSIPRALLEIAFASLLAVILLRFLAPLSFLHLYNGSYFASFLLIVGLVLHSIHYQAIPTLIQVKVGYLLAAAFAALVLHLLVTAWLDATLIESWAGLWRWFRFPVLLVAALAYQSAEELILASLALPSPAARFLAPMALRLVAWLAILFGIFFLHSGAILLVLLALYLAAFFSLQLLGAEVVRNATRSPLAAALFGAILLAGFCLVIFPVT
jgi:pimeloyl-ACP methyl ester carboxylesterase